MARCNGEAVIGAALIVGAGVSGVQAALDLAEAGVRVYVVERQPAIGGRMAQLDKTFPTNDCSMCTLAPRLVDCDRHPNITVFTGAEVRAMSGRAGAFRVRVRRRARYVDLARCTGCGDCAAVCPIEVPDEFNGGLNLRKVIYRPYAQAVPSAFTIDMANCPECVECTEACVAGAIDPFMVDTEIELNVGALIVSPGYDLFDARRRPEFGYGVFANVVTSLQFERMLAAAGPTKGHPERPSDGRAPRRVAFIQCVGSRDVAGGQEYCSAVCCMYTAKQAAVAAEHLPGLRSTVFCADIRAHGKGFEGYYQRAVAQGVRYVRSLISTIKELPGSRNLLLRYYAEDGYREDEFDLVVLAVGMRPPEGMHALARVGGFALDEYGFIETCELCPGQTTRPGIFAGGAACGPKDIPETVVEASAAAAGVSCLLAPARGSLTVARSFPPEKDIHGEEPRVGVFVCHCGLNIGSVVDVPALVERARGLNGVVWAQEFLFACSQDSIGHLAACVEEHRLNRVVVASCTPRTHAPLFQAALREAGLNPSLYEHVNIREQVSWVHQGEPEQATEKGWDLIRMAVAKARLLKPVITHRTAVEPRALVVGGGASGMTAALTLAEQGFPVTLVEREQLLGGNLRHLHCTLYGSDPQGFLEDLTERVEGHPGVEVLTGSTVESVAGYTGQYRSIIRQGYLKREIAHGVVILATGAVEYRPARGEYLFGEHPGVLTQTELEARLAAGRVRNVRRAVMIQCVGSRDAERPYCSRVCCGHAVKNALRLKELSPRTEVVVLFRDIRTYGLQERYYRLARDKGVLFVRYEPERRPLVRGQDGGGLTVEIYDQVLNEELTLAADLVVLSTGIVPRPDAPELAQLLRVPLGGDGFFAEAHAKLRPVDFPTEGMYLCGLAHAPKTLSESVTQAQAAAMRAVTLLARGELESERCVVTVDPARCTGCGLCVEVCPYGARELDAGRKVAVVHEALCRGCGTCVAACPNGACQQYNFEDGQILAMLDEMLCQAPVTTLSAGGVSVARDEDVSGRFRREPGEGGAPPAPSRIERP